ncbi:uncharacterized protein VTP21DRAFT_5601 [Calcarisporiella thermophila]|uniref:uncharacterized protein n=1 Tax=Calcarisporiella thermophila TaxID=911321 RepID=UPI0037442F91
MEFPTIPSSWHYWPILSCTLDTNGNLMPTTSASLPTLPSVLAPYPHAPSYSSSCLPTPPLTAISTPTPPPSSQLLASAHHPPTPPPKRKQQQQQQQQQQKTPDFKPTFYDPFQIKHRRRASKSQLRILEQSFGENPKPNAAVRRALAQRLDMTCRNVQIWFQNRRAKAKKASRAAVGANLKGAKHALPLESKQSGRKGDADEEDEEEERVKSEEEDGRVPEDMSLELEGVLVDEDDDEDDDEDEEKENACPAASNNQPAAPASAEVTRRDDLFLPSGYLSNFANNMASEEFASAAEKAIVNGVEDAFVGYLPPHFFSPTEQKKRYELGYLPDDFVSELKTFPLVHVHSQPGTTQPMGGDEKSAHQLVRGHSLDSAVWNPSLY